MLGYGISSKEKKGTLLTLARNHWCPSHSFKEVNLFKMMKQRKIILPQHKRRIRRGRREVENRSYFFPSSLSYNLLNTDCCYTNASRDYMILKQTMCFQNVTFNFYPSTLEKEHHRSENYGNNAIARHNVTVNEAQTIT